MPEWPNEVTGFSAFIATNPDMLGVEWNGRMVLSWLSEWLLISMFKPRIMIVSFKRLANASPEAADLRLHTGGIKTLLFPNLTDLPT